MFRAKKTVTLPDSPNACGANAHFSRHSACAPVCCVPWVLLGCLANNLCLKRTVLHCRFAATPLRVLLDACKTAVCEPTAPKAHGLHVNLEVGGNALSAFDVEFLSLQPRRGISQGDREWSVVG